MSWTREDALQAIEAAVNAMTTVIEKFEAERSVGADIEVVRTALAKLKNYDEHRFPTGDGTVRTLLESEGRG